MLQQHARLQQELAGSEAHSSELEAREQDLQNQLSSREAELLSANSRLSEEQAAQADTQRQLHQVWRLLFVQHGHCTLLDRQSMVTAYCMIGKACPLLHSKFRVYGLKRQLHLARHALLCSISYSLPFGLYKLWIIVTEAAAHVLLCSISYFLPFGLYNCKLITD